MVRQVLFFLKITGGEEKKALPIEAVTILTFGTKAG